MANRWETVTDFIFFGSKITADGDCSHEFKRHRLLGRKAMANLDSILKSRDITLPTKGHLVKAIVFPVVMWKVNVVCWHPCDWREAGRVYTALFHYIQDIALKIYSL